MSRSYQIDFRNPREHEPNGTWFLFRFTEKPNSKARTFTSRAGNIIEVQPTNYMVRVDDLEQLMYVLAIDASKHDDELLNHRKPLERFSKPRRPLSLVRPLKQKLKGKRRSKGCAAKPSLSP
jgi:hypothetical protein